MKNIIKVFEPSLKILLTSHAFGLTIRKTTNRGLVNSSDFFDHLLKFELTSLDIFYGILLTTTVLYSLKDVSYEKSYKSIKNTPLQTIPYSVEFIILTLALLFFQNVERAT